MRGRGSITVSCSEISPVRSIAGVGFLLDTKTAVGEEVLS